MNSKDLIMNILQNAQSSDFDDLPNIDLYMDQVTTYLNKKLSFAKRFEDDKLLTKTMINNYAKSRLLPAPEKKKYSQDHILILAMIFFFKNVISINDVNTILSPMIQEHFHNEDAPLSDFMNEFLKYTQNNNISEHILSDYKKSVTAFENFDSEEKEYLQTLALVSMLSYENFIRKLIIEQLIDSLPDSLSAKETSSETQSANTTKERKTEKKKDSEKKKSK